jgi:Ca2+-binding RTX toxin-like protein
MAIVDAGLAGIDMDRLNLGDLIGAVISGASSTTFVLNRPGLELFVTGTGFLFDSTVTAGVIDSVRAVMGGVTVYSISELSISATAFMDWISSADTASAKLAMLAGADQITGSEYGDVLRGYAGADTILGAGGTDYLDGGEGADNVLGGAGDDTVVDSAGANYLRGNEGNDYILGGAEFDDAHGNEGNDTVYGGPGDDWVVGGKDNDILYGEVGVDIVYGNLGNDTCYGGDGADLVRGGQADDVIYGDLGADWLSGDRGDDTIYGGGGADIFHSFGDAGIDRIMDFSIAQGDRIQLDPGSFYNITQSGADTLISLSGGAQIVLVGVSMASLTTSTIFIG